MIQPLCLLLKSEFQGKGNKEHSVRIDLKDVLEEEGYFFSSLIQDPILGIKYDDSRIKMELLYEAPDISKHIEKLGTFLEKTISFVVLPYIKSHSYSVEMRTNNYLAICVRSQVSEKDQYERAIEMLVIELFAMLALY